jgi:membrane associated rhomboid family serine protease
MLSFTSFLCLGQLVLLAIMMKDSFAPIAENPSIGPTYATLIKFGAKSTPLMLDDNQTWRFFSSSFLCAGVLHAIFNMFVQFRLGMFLEREWGWVWFLTTYIISGLGGTVLSCVVEPHKVGVGATGAVAGLVTAFGVQVLLCYRILDSFQRRLQALQFAFFCAIVLLLVLCPLVNSSDVLGGCYVGVMIGIVIWAAEEHHRVWVIPASILLLSFAGGFSYLYLYMK